MGYRYSFDVKRTTDSYKKLDIRYLARKKMIKPDQADFHSYLMNWYRNGEKTDSISIRTERDQILLTYTNTHHATGEKEEMEYPILVKWTACNFGGKRPWFYCPHCGRRVAILYSAKLFLCRHCLDLAYSCQREQAYDRAARRAEKIRDKLKWEWSGILDGHEPKTKGMHEKTYQRLVTEHDYHMERCEREFTSKFGYWVG